MLVVLLGRVIRLNDRPVQAIPEAAAIITSNSTNKHRPKRKHKHKRKPKVVDMAIRTAIITTIQLAHRVVAAVTAASRPPLSRYLTF